MNTAELFFEKTDFDAVVKEAPEKDIVFVGSNTDESRR